MGKWEAFKLLLFGERGFRPHSEESFTYKVDRLTVDVHWSNYRKYRGFWRAPERYQGHPRVEIAFNPGLDEKLFDSLRTLGETVFFVSPETTAEDIKDSLSSDFSIQRDCPHVLEVLVRGPRDVDEIVRYFDKLAQLSDKYPHRLNGPLTVKERVAMDFWLKALAYAGHNGNFSRPLTVSFVNSQTKQAEMLYGA